MKKANRQIVDSGRAPQGDGKHGSEGVKGNLLPVSKWYSIRKPLGVIAVMMVALGITFVAVSNFIRVTGAHSVKPLESSPQLGSPPFANPSEVRYRAGEKRLRAVMELKAGNYTIPNVGAATLRQLQGWDPAQPAPPAKTDIGPGPTLRAWPGRSKPRGAPPPRRSRVASRWPCWTGPRSRRWRGPAWPPAPSPTSTRAAAGAPPRST